MSDTTPVYETIADIDNDDNTTVRFYDGEVIAVMKDWKLSGDDRNGVVAKRIRDSWNACRTIPTDQLAGLDVAKVLEELADATKEVNRLEEQRKRHDDEICSALRIGRHHELVDKSFLAGLTPEEEAEDKRICDGMDAFDARYYKPSIEMLDHLTRVKEERDALFVLLEVRGKERDAFKAFAGKVRTALKENYPTDLMVELDEELYDLERQYPTEQEAATK